MWILFVAILLVGAALIIRWLHKRLKWAEETCGILLRLIVEQIEVSSEISEIGKGCAKDCGLPRCPGEIGLSKLREEATKRLKMLPLRVYGRQQTADTTAGNPEGDNP
jgi:hypothetical protein